MRNPETVAETTPSFQKRNGSETGMPQTRTSTSVSVKRHLKRPPCFSLKRSTTPLGVER